MSLKDLARKTVGAIAAACSRDSDLRSRVQADPKSALAEEGVELPFDEVKVVEDTPETTHVPLTAPGSEMSDEQMEAVVGGVVPPMPDPSNPGAWSAFIEQQQRLADHITRS